MVSHMKEPSPLSARTSDRLTLRKQRSSIISREELNMWHGLNDANMTRHRVYYWIRVHKGDDCREIDPDDVAQTAGVPERIILDYWRKELKKETAIKSLPGAIGLVFLYAMLMLCQETPSPVQSLEHAIGADIYENANFAYSGHMGHKNLIDVNSYADFWSWLDLGFQAVYMPHVTALSENSSLRSQALNRSEANLFLWHNRKIGPVRLSKQVLKGDLKCPNPEVADALGVSCQERGGIYLNIKPTDFAIETGPFIEDTSATVFLRFGNATKRQQVLQELESSGWLDPNTFHVKVSFLTYNANFDLLALTSIHFTFHRTGHIYKNIVHETAMLKPYEAWYLPVIQGLFWAQIVFLLFQENMEIYQTLTRELQHGHHFWEWLKSYATVWNFVDWISILLAFAILGLWINQTIWQSHIQTKLLSYEALRCWDEADDTCDAAFADLMNQVDALALQMRRAGIVMGFYPICIMLRLFKAFSHQPRLAVVTRTMSSAAGDLFHFGLVFMSIYVTYGYMAQAFFGRECEDFATVGTSLIMLFRLLQGDFDTEPMFQAVGRPIGFIFFSSYMLLTVMLLLNMLIAIIMDVYEKSKAEALSSELLWEDCFTMIRRAVETWQGRRLRLQQAFDKYLDQWGDEALKSERIIFPHDLILAVPDLAELQAHRHFRNALKRWSKSNKADVENSEVLTAVHMLHHHVLQPAISSEADVDLPGLPAEKSSCLPDDAETAFVQDVCLKVEDNTDITEVSASAHEKSLKFMDREEVEADLPTLNKAFEEEEDAVAELAKQPLHRLIRAVESRLASNPIKNAEASKLISTLLASTMYVVENEVAVHPV
eukprot:TRINITY_DN27989_c1_g1_i1.p1 TRINITY_DN27989_c1_g1~~TRINITY_DN27989_c1_g1_i1.p1  ORF type:complete len:830 (-),score=164.19 TRINITY_DN27989_c1_g1_i1:144-2633(-)